MLPTCAKTDNTVDQRRVSKPDFTEVFISGNYGAQKTAWVPQSVVDEFITTRNVPPRTSAEAGQFLRRIKSTVEFNDTCGGLNKTLLR